MENVGAIFEEEWNSASGMCSEEANFMAHLLENSSLPNELLNGFQYAVSWPENFTIAEADESSAYSSDDTNKCMFSFSQGSSSYSGGSRFFSPYSSNESHCPSQIFVHNDNLVAMNYSMVDDENKSSRMHLFTSNSMEDGFLDQDISNDSSESNEDLPEDYPLQNNLQKIENPLENRIGSSSVISNKRPRIPAGEKSKRFKKASNQVDTDGVYDNYKNNSMPRSNSFCSDDDSIVSREINGITSSTGALKTRASRGSATDPQSLYARKRRERINERLKILQHLVPNGTKVDISTMLEEAVEYVKFLQLQIKLLSSDDHWMYAPLAYNGMEIGLDLKISASLS